MAKKNLSLKSFRIFNRNKERSAAFLFVVDNQIK